MHAEIVGVSAGLEGTVERAIILAHCIVVGSTIGGEVDNWFGLDGGLLLHQELSNIIKDLPLELISTTLHIQLKTNNSLKRKRKYLSK